MINTIKTILIILFVAFLFSCHSSKSANLKPQAETISIDLHARNLYIKYQPDSYNKWQKLNKLLENDSIPSDELNVIDCRGFNSHSEELVLRKTLRYYILGKIYWWSEFETEHGKCILLSNVYGSFFLSKIEASVLLSASIGYNFEKLNLEFPKILYKRTILNDLKGYFCGSTTMQQKENMTIHKGGCSESIYYEYESKKPPKNTSQFQFTF